MAQIIESIGAHYSTLEVPFGRVYSWHPARVRLQCVCGAKITFTGKNAVTSCKKCGAEYGDLVSDIRHREERLRDEDEHPWYYDEQSQAAQHLQDEDACTEDSPWRYNDVTLGFVGADEERWKKARVWRGL